MKSILLLLLFSSLAVIGLTRDLKEEYVINLDLPAEDRFNSTFPLHDPAMQVSEMIYSHLNSMSSYIIPFLEVVYQVFLKFEFQQERIREIQGMAKALNISEEKIFIANIIYDIGAHCTSIISKNAQGEILFGRNLDYVFKSMLVASHFVAVYKREGKELYRCSTFVGFVGSITCVKGGKFAVSINQRRVDPSQNGLLQNFLALILGRAPATWHVRHVLDKAESFSQAEEMLGSEILVSPAYYILAGTKGNDGVVIARDRVTVANKWRLGAEQGSWFIAQTNSDTWTNAECSRQSCAKGALVQIGQDKINVEGMSSVLLKSPVFNGATIVSAVMNVTTGTIDYLQIHEN